MKSLSKPPERAAQDAESNVDARIRAGLLQKGWAEHGATTTVNVVASWIQRLVRATHDWPLAGSMYRSIYAVAAGSVGDLASREPRLAGVYARHSYALGTWEPGRSDIDITAVWMDPNPELVDQFYRDYARLQRRFPMLGEVEMIDERHLAAYTTRGVSGLESRRWKRLGGKHSFECRYAGDERMDRIRHAVSIYCHQFLPRFWEQPRQVNTLSRLTAKVARQLDESSSKETDPATLLGICLHKLGQAIRKLPAADKTPMVDYCELLGTLGQPQAPAESGGSQADAAILSAIGHSGGAVRHVIVRDDFDVKSIDPRYQNATIMNAEVFRFYLSFVDPLEHFTLLLGRSVHEGTDPLHDPFPLSKSALRETVCHYAVDLLTFPYRPGLATMTDRQFRDLLYGWFLRTLKYFEDGKFTFSYDELRAHFGPRYEESQARFPLLHSIAADVSSHMAR
ncbi:MAG: hypothetical protein ABI972_04640 [Acidobacteriota bacterium]